MRSVDGGRRAASGPEQARVLVLVLRREDREHRRERLHVGGGEGAGRRRRRPGSRRRARRACAAPRAWPSGTAFIAACDHVLGPAGGEGDEHVARASRRCRRRRGRTRSARSAPAQRLEARQARVGGAAMAQPERERAAHLLGLLRSSSPVSRVVANQRFSASTRSTSPRRQAASARGDDRQVGAREAETELVDEPALRARLVADEARLDRRLEAFRIAEAADRQARRRQPHQLEQRRGRERRRRARDGERAAAWSWPLPGPWPCAVIVVDASWS